MMKSQNLIVFYLFVLLTFYNCLSLNLKKKNLKTICEREGENCVDHIPCCDDMEWISEGLNLSQTYTNWVCGYKKKKSTGMQ